MSKTYKIVNKKGKKAKSWKHAKIKEIDTDYFCRCEWCKNKQKRELDTQKNIFKIQIKELENEN